MNIKVCAWDQPCSGVQLTSGVPAALTVMQLHENHLGLFPGRLWFKKGVFGA